MQILGCFVDELARQSMDNKCEPSFSVSAIDDRSFEVGSWENETKNSGMSQDPWKYHSMTETGALPYAGRLTSYPGQRLPLRL